MEWQEIFMVATTSIGFIYLTKALFQFLNWVWVMFLRPPKNLKEHYGSWAMVTGATDGIGKAMAFELASKGLNLLLVGRNPMKLESTSNEIFCKHNNNVEVKGVVIDFGRDSGEEITKIVREAIEGLDLGMLVNSAGLAYPYARFFHEVDPMLMDDVIKVNVEGTTWITKAVIPSMIKKKRGAIINIGSGSSVVPSYPLVTLYAASKAYLAMLSRCMSLEYKHQGIDIQCQVPLFVSTKMTKLRASLFVPTPEMYSKICTRCIGYENVVVPYYLHSLQFLLIMAIPHSFFNFYMMRYNMYYRKRGLLKESKTKASSASFNSQANINTNEAHSSTS